MLTDRGSSLRMESNFTSAKYKRIVIFNFAFIMDTTQVDRTGKKTTAVIVKVPKDYSYQDTIYEECVHCLENDSIPEVNVCFIRFHRSFYIYFFTVSNR